LLCLSLRSGLSGLAERAANRLAQGRPIRLIKYS
jgi:hypothetical protein